MIKDLKVYLKYFMNLYLSQKKTLTFIGTFMNILSFAGQSRSVAFMLYYLMMKYSLSYQKAFDKLKLVYPLASPN